MATGGGSGLIEADVVVVGGGLSGLTAARHVLDKDASLTVLVLEAKDRLGGRTLTVPLKAANNTEDCWDLGGQWVGNLECQPHITALLRELDIGVYRQHLDGVKVMQLGNNKIRKYSSTIPSLSLLGLVDMETLLRKIEKFIKQVPIEDPSSCKNAEEWDRITMGEFVYNHSWTKDVRDAMGVACETMFGVEQNQLSLLYALAYMNGTGGVRPAIEATKDSGQEFKIKGGAQQVSRRLAEIIGMDKILLDHPVRSVSQDEASVLVTTESGKQFQCKRVIMAAPPHQIAKLTFDPCLPADKTVLFNHMPVGHIIKVIVTYEKTFWRDAGYSGEIVTYGGDSQTDGCTSGPLGVVYDATSPNGNPALVVFISARKAVEYSIKSVEERKTAVLKSLSEFFGPDALQCTDFAEKDWKNEPYNGGCPVSIVTPGVMNYFAEGLRKPFQRIHFAGTESATVWSGFLNGAVQAGTRAATEVLYHIRPQTVTASELKGTAYDTSSCRNNVHKTHKRATLKWVVVLGIGASLAFVGYRIYRTNY